MIERGRNNFIFFFCMGGEGGQGERTNEREGEGWDNTKAPGGRKGEKERVRTEKSNSREKKN